MKNLTKKRSIKLRKQQINTCYIPLFKQLQETAKQIFICLLNIFIFVCCYYVYVCTYNFNNDDCELITAYTTSFVELKPVEQSNIWYKYFIDDFFNKFTSKSKTINFKNIEIKSDYFQKKLLLEHNLETVKKPIILNKTQSYHMKSLELECEYYKNRTTLLEVQLLNTKIICHNLVKDIYDITKDMKYLLKP